MKFSVILLGAALCLFSSTEAGISTTTPYKSITWNSGENVKVVWVDDGTAPTLDQIGLTNVDLMAGGDSAQIAVARIGQAQASAKEIDYIVPTNIGPSGDNYFIKFTAGDYSSYSGTFSIQGISGVLGSAFDPKNPTGKVPATSATSATSANSATPATPANSTSTSGGPNAASASNSAVKSPLPSTLSNAANLLPSFAGIATAAVALTLTYFY